MLNISQAQLQKQFLLPPRDLFRYLQIRHYIQSNEEWGRIKADPTSMEKHFYSVLEKPLPTKNHVSHIYRFLMGDVGENTYSFRDK